MAAGDTAANSEGTGDNASTEGVATAATVSQIPERQPRVVYVKCRVANV